MLFTPQIGPPHPKLALLARKFHLFLYPLSRFKICPWASKWFEFRTESRNLLPIAKPSNRDARFPWTDLFNTDAKQSPSCRLGIWTVCRTRAWANREPTVLLPETKMSVEQVAKGNQAWRVSPPQNTRFQLLLDSDECVMQLWALVTYPTVLSSFPWDRRGWCMCTPVFRVPLVPKVLHFLKCLFYIL